MIQNTVQNISLPTRKDWYISGGDEQLAKAYIEVLDGKQSKSDLKQGLASAAACLAAKKAAESGKEERIFYGF